MSMAFSTHKQHLPNLYGATAAPPPTPSVQSNNNHNATSSAAADALSNLLHRLPPTLSLPKRRSSPSTTATTTSPPPSISFSDTNFSNLLLSSATELGFFQLTNHDIPSQLANSAETESLSLFELTEHQKRSCFPKNWPLGFFDADTSDDEDDEDSDRNGKGESFCLDAACSTESTELSLSSLREFTRGLQSLGLKIIDTLANEVGFENPIREDPTRVCSLMWISEGLHGDKQSGGFYPYVIGLQYQIRCQKYSLLKDSGLVSVLPQVDSILVTLGDIAQVWSNGKLSKVRGRPVTCFSDGNKSRCVTMSLLVTLPANSLVTPLLPKVVIDEDDIGISDEDENKEQQEKRLFNSFSFEDYAWRVYHHDCFLFKDPLARYRI